MPPRLVTAAADGTCSTCATPSASSALPPARPLISSKGITSPRKARTSATLELSSGTFGRVGTVSPFGVHSTSSPPRTCAKATGSSTAKHRSSSSALTAKSPSRPASAHHTTSVSSATARRLRGLRAHSVRQLCRRSASLMSITRGSSTMSISMPTSAVSSASERRVGRLARPCDLNRGAPLRCRRSTCVASPTRPTDATSDATCGPKVPSSCSKVTGVSSTQSCRMVATTVSTARGDSASPAGTVAARMRADAIQCAMYGSPLLRCCPRCAICAKSAARRTSGCDITSSPLTSTPQSSVRRLAPCRSRACGCAPSP
mmetsp:Transcript_17414/g.53943  ORF Transcript_17414/g.53943 Transcript_17414/m.53943 type:complete len:317 (-) Transcript_17414:165-1115(-)